MYLSPEGCDVDYLYREDFLSIRKKHIYDPILIIDNEKDNFRSFPDTIYHLSVEENYAIRFESVYMEGFDDNIDVLVNIPFHHTSEISSVIKQINEYFKSKIFPSRYNNNTIDFVVSVLKGDKKLVEFNNQGPVEHLTITDGDKNLISILTGGLNISFIDREMRPNSFWKKIFLEESFLFNLDYPDLDIGIGKRFYDEKRFVFGKEYVKIHGSRNQGEDVTDSIIEKLFPDISFMKYKKTMKDVLVSDTYEVHDYYSESQTKTFTMFSVRELIDRLIMENPERYGKYVYKD